MRRMTFRCDDAAGFQLSILCADDGDFHLSICPAPNDMDVEDRALYAPCYGASVRVRMPMIGGGAHEALWHACAALFKALPPTVEYRGLRHN